MDVTRVQSAPLLLPSGESSNAASTALVRASHGISPLSTAQGVTAYPQGSGVWSVAVGDDGAYYFYAGYADEDDGSRQRAQDSSYSASYANQGAWWNAPQVTDAAAHYAMYASLSADSFGHMVDFYA